MCILKQTVSFPLLELPMHDPVIQYALIYVLTTCCFTALRTVITLCRISSSSVLSQ
jgi:hypothetical protein